MGRPEEEQAAVPQPQPQAQPQLQQVCPGNGAQLGGPLMVHPQDDLAPGQTIIFSDLKLTEEKSLAEAYMRCIPPLGFFGFHHFYLKRPAFGVLYVFTFGLAGFGWFVDIFRLPWLVHQYNKKAAERLPGQADVDEKTISDAYLLWFPFGFLGLHHYYLGRWGWGIAYTCTCGLFGIGWLVDGIRIPLLVRDTNEELHRQFELNGVPEKKLSDALLLAFPPFGLLGFHHYYLERHYWGLLYTCTCGLFGVGWLFDLCRMWLLVERANAHKKNQVLIKQKYYDDTYILWFPLGFLGLHHFYLKRPMWGILYLCTCGLFGIGWLTDICRIPFLVRDTNEKIASQTVLTAIVTEGGCSGNHTSISTPHPHSAVIIRVEENINNSTANYPGYPGIGNNHMYPQSGATSGVILQPPPAYLEPQPPSYDSLASSDVGHENEGVPNPGFASSTSLPVYDNAEAMQSNADEGMDKPPLE